MIRRRVHKSSSPSTCTNCQFLQKLLLVCVYFLHLESPLFYKQCNVQDGHSDNSPSSKCCCDCSWCGGPMTPCHSKISCLLFAVCVITMCLDVWIQIFLNNFWFSVVCGLVSVHIRVRFPFSCSHYSLSLICQPDIREHEALHHQLQPLLVRQHQSCINVEKRVYTHNFKRV